MNMGTLYIVATPIGNLEDITLRALRVLKEVDLIACEDTRHTRKLLTHYGISKPLLSYYSHNQFFRVPQILAQLKEGKSVALVTDAGTPGISDPGAVLIGEAVKEGVLVLPIPGPSALIAALSASGLPTDRFYFQGFLPQKSGRRKNVLASLKGIPATLVFYEPARRLFKLMGEIEEVFGGGVSVAIGRELTKVYEEFLRGTAEELRRKIPAEGLKGESVVLVRNFGREGDST